MKIELDKHLGNCNELFEFLLAMRKELTKHRDEKKPLRDVDLDIVKDIVTEEVEKRIEKVKRQGRIDKEMAEKQCVHMANYLMMLYTKLNMEKNE